MLSAIQRFITDERGASAVEYGLLIALIAVAIIGGATLLGINLDTMFRDVADEIVEPAPPAG